MDCLFKSIIDRFRSQHLSLDPRELFIDFSDKDGSEFLGGCRTSACSSGTWCWVLDSKRFRSMLSAYGYLLHQHWNDYKCVIFVDEDMESGKANGRTVNCGVERFSFGSTEYLCHRCCDHSKKWNPLLVRTSHSPLSLSSRNTSPLMMLAMILADSLFSAITGLTCNAKYGQLTKFGKKKLK